ncbi:hypothetical protein Dxin01_03577 [Deinococcus xinjiangensis]|uniref:DUF305 domain-containing protein n=1 Tax=Deinococcus xinjiangensis TaxID=457454 RepID=A0ABP9VF12_9DEIO
MKTLTTIGIGALALGTLAFAQMTMNGQTGMGQNQTMMAQGNMGGMNHSMMGGGMMGGMSGMSQMMGGMNAGNIDRNFLTMMIPHHQSAIDMSQLVLKTTKDPQVKTWATNIIRDQQREITQMQGLLKGYGGPVQGMSGQMNQMMGDMTGPINKAANKDVAFVQGMLPHHGMAIMMADHLLMQSKNPVMQKLGRDIITAQAGEMYEFQQYLNKTK